MNKKRKRKHQQQPRIEMKIGQTSKSKMDLVSIKNQGF